jgi:hypothetical protein
MTAAIGATALGWTPEDARAFDVTQPYPWLPRYRERALANQFSDRKAGREGELAWDPAAHEALIRANETGDCAPGDPFNASLGTGSVREVHFAHLTRRPSDGPP